MSELCKHCGSALECEGCGSTKSMAEIKADRPEAISCCPERKMRPSSQPGRVPTDDEVEKVILEAVRKDKRLNRLAYTSWKDGIDIERATFGAITLGRAILSLTKGTEPGAVTDDQSALEVARNDTIQECASIAREFNDCGGDFIAQKIQDLALSRNSTDE